MVSLYSDVHGMHATFKALCLPHYYMALCDKTNTKRDGSIIAFNKLWKAVTVGQIYSSEYINCYFSNSNNGLHRQIYIILPLPLYLYTPQTVEFGWGKIPPVQ